MGIITYLKICADMSPSILTREIKADTAEINDVTADIKSDTETILAEIAKLQTLLPPNYSGQSGNNFMLDRYLESLTSYAESVLDDEIPEVASNNDKIHIEAPTAIEQDNVNTPKLYHILPSLNRTTSNEVDGKHRCLICLTPFEEESTCHVCGVEADTHLWTSSDFSPLDAEPASRSDLRNVPNQPQNILYPPIVLSRIASQTSTHSQEDADSAGTNVRLPAPKQEPPRRSILKYPNDLPKLREDINYDVVPSTNVIRLSFRPSTPPQGWRGSSRVEEGEDVSSLQHAISLTSGHSQRDSGALEVALQFKKSLSVLESALQVQKDGWSQGLIKHSPRVRETLKAVLPDTATPSELAGIRYVESDMTWLNFVGSENHASREGFLDEIKRSVRLVFSIQYDARKRSRDLIWGNLLVLHEFIDGLYRHNYTPHEILVTISACDDSWAEVRNTTVRAATVTVERHLMSLGILPDAPSDEWPIWQKERTTRIFEVCPLSTLTRSLSSDHTHRAIYVWPVRSTVRR